jgi:branched-subunit amino acid ABC-type transport system permease component
MALLWSFIYTSWAIMGRLGLVSFGHGAFLGIGAYTVVLLWNLYGISPWIGAIVALVITLVVAFVIGYPCFRFKIVGHYFALVTLALSEVTRLIIVGLRDYTAAQLEDAVTRVEKAIHVEEVPVDMRSRSTALFVEGARARGVEMMPIRRNTKGCDGCGRCNFGCPHGAKMSVDLSYLPRAVEAGAQVWSHTLVERVVMKGRRAVGVTGRLLDGQGHGAGLWLLMALACLAGLVLARDLGPRRTFG